MKNGTDRSRLLLLSASTLAVAWAVSSTAMAQTAASGNAAAPAIQAAKKRQAVRPAAAPPAEAGTALAQASGTTVQSLDTITVTATKTEERAIDALAPSSVVTLDQIQSTQANRLQDVFRTVPGVAFQDRGDDPSTAINIRGLQDFGRVAVTVDGARQNYQRSGHNANGSFFLDPELIGAVDITRGPSANVYGSGAIGGVVSFRTKEIDDVVRAGERWGVDLNGYIGSNKDRGLGSVFGGMRFNPAFDVFGGAIYRTSSNYKDGAGTTIGNTGNEVVGGLVKLTARPWDGHEVRLGGVFQDFQYNIGQANRGPTTTAAPAAAIAGTSVYASDTRNNLGTLSWNYFRPDDNLFNFSANLYGNQTENEQTKTYNNRITTGGGICTLANPGNNITGCVGDKRSYTLDTVGFDINNTSRFFIGNWSNAITVGGDVFNDDVRTTDQRGNSNITTPSGERTVSGAFVQMKSRYANWLEVIGALRFDQYSLSSATTSSDGSRLSPKITVGLTPFAGLTPYVSYAEGYRAPSITETLIAGGHATGGGPALFVCPDGTSGLFCFQPNPNLRPEVGKNSEAGINLKLDRVFTPADTLRAKFNVFHNDVEDYIDLVASPPQASPFGVFSKFYQYQNLPNAKLRGFEAETLYDSGFWFVGVAATVVEGRNAATGIGLGNIQPRRITTTAGVRAFDQRLVASVQWLSASANRDLPAGYLPSTSYDLVNLYVTYRATPDVSITGSIDNLLNRYYRPYAIPGSSTDGTTQNDVLFSSPGPGIVYKAGLKVHFGGA